MNTLTTAVKEKHLPGFKWLSQLTYIDWIILVIGSIPAFYLLHVPAIYIWDEAVYANASWDMAHGHSWLMPVQGHYNTKPPLVLWMQALSLKFFPWTEFAIRFPSAMSVTGICLLLLFFLKRWGFDQWTRVWVILCFVCHEGFVRHHISRTGDLDAVMCFFVTTYCLIILDSLYFKKWNDKYLYGFFIAVTLAFYAKSIAGWMMLGPLLIVWLMSPLRSVLYTKKFILCAFFTLSICLLYYFVREIGQPGFLRLVWESEYLRIAKNIMPWHEHPAGYYFSNWVVLNIFNPWCWLLAISVIFVLIREQKLLLLWIVVIALGYMLLIAVPAVKLEWYDAPAYPFFAVLMGVMIGRLIGYVPLQLKWIFLLPALFIFWRKMDFIQRDIYPRHWFEYEGSMLRKTQNIDGLKVFMPAEHPEHRLQLDFYRKVFLEKKHFDVPVLTHVNEVKAGDRILARRGEFADSLGQAFHIDTLSIWAGMGYEFKILSRD